MPTVGFLRVSAYTSRAQIPLENVAVSVVSNDGRLLGLRITDSSGLTTPITIEVPDKENSQSPGIGLPAYTSVNLYARAENYEQILVQGVQVFADTVTMQDLAMVPLSEMPSKWNQTEIINTPPQNL